MFVATDIRALALDPRAPTRGSAVTLGNFDGVHLGHRALLRKTVALARERGLPAAAVTFDPHPLRLLKGKDAPPQLLSLRRKLECFGQLGLDLALVLPFTRETASLTPEEFVRIVLLDALHTRALVVGYDYAFGKDRRGNAALLGELGRAHGFSVEEAPALRTEGEPVSSTRVRALLREGDVAGVARLLGRPFSVEGIVEHGKARGGSLLGFPTANLRPEEEVLLPKYGVYAVSVEINPGSGGRMLRGVANVGVNPTFGDGFARVETHILNFCGDLYGLPLGVHFLQRLRDERKFGSVDELIARIRLDVREVENMTAEALCPQGGGT
ncbi:MAG: bifunctional riboflavin kinase/FAD synthetase [Desulfovibrio sp.]|nr:bifunctional riboflavin kinase/FAD synthetase [Desulfovibrio sp.]